MRKVTLRWIVIGLVAMAGVGAIAINGWQHYASIPYEVRKAQADACVAKNRTWSPRFDMFGALVEIRCNKTKYMEHLP